MPNTATRTGPNVKKGFGLDHFKQESHEDQTPGIGVPFAGVHRLIASSGLSVVLALEEDGFVNNAIRHLPYLDLMVLTGWTARLLRERVDHGWRP
jgi:hypothetical protein